MISRRSLMNGIIGSACAAHLPLKNLALGPVVRSPNFAPGARVIADSHNCYPYNGQWKDRIDRALSGGLPVAIEQDLHWFTPPDGGQSRSVVAHVAPLTGQEPGMEDYFFHKVQPYVKAALASSDQSNWPIITLNLDFKTEEVEHLRAVWTLLMKYKAWLTTVPKALDLKRKALTVGPILVLNGPSDAQQQVFYDALPIGAELLTFGAVHTSGAKFGAPPEEVEVEEATNYRRWWNNPWEVIEPEGQGKAGPWNEEHYDRLAAFVRQAHQRGLWIRFYTLDGVPKQALAENGWSSHYNFSSADAVRSRWAACIRAKVDYIASDEYENLSRLVRDSRTR